MMCAHPVRPLVPLCGWQDRTLSTGASPLHQRESLAGGDPDRDESESGERDAAIPRARRAVPPVRMRDRPESPSAAPANNAALAFMAHELRTPLTAIIGLADLLKDSQLSEDQRDMLDIMGRSARALVEIVNGVLDLEKLEAGKLQLERRTFSPGDTVEECVNLLAASAAQKGIDLAFFIDDDVPSLIQGDQVRLRQALINLLGNALKFTEEGQVVVTVTCVQRTDDRCELQFAIDDSGPGIPAEFMESLFEPYAQAEASTSRRFGGTGLGLPIAKRLVALMGGRIGVESVVGKGSTFTFTLPSALEAGAGVRAPRSDAALAGRRVLVVEDNPIVGELLVAVLARWDVKATLAADPAHAVTALREGAFSLALIDGEMPGSSGRAVALALRSLPGQSNLPLVLMTTLGAHAAAVERTGEGNEGRFAAYVTKPVRPARLCEALVHAFAVHAPAAPTSPLPPPSPPQGKARVVSDERPTGGGAIGERASARRLHGVRVLLTDDDPDLRAVLERTLANAGAEVRTVEDGARALSTAWSWDADTILLDASMPGMDGFEVCRRLKADPATRLVPVLMITGFDTADDRRRVLEAGADGIIPKPFVREELLRRVGSAARMKQATDRLERNDETLVVMARTVEGKDPDTLGHLERLSDYSARLAARIGMNETEVLALRLSALLHDIGKVALPEAILRKASTLDEEERAMMRAHPVEGERLCSGVPNFSGVLPIIRHHHEKLDGSGYPDGLMGSAIPAAARVLQVVDVYDALTTARRYRRAESPEGALRIMEQEVDKGWWDPTIFSAFRDLVREDLHARRGSGVQRH